MDNGQTAIVKRRPNITATLALLVSLAAFALSWIAYNRTGQDLEDSIAEQVNRATQTGQQATDAVEREVDTGPDGIDDGAR